MAMRQASYKVSFCTVSHFLELFSRDVETIDYTLEMG